MAQLSRPYQIGLAALGVFALAWFAVLHRPGSSPSEPASAPSTHVSSSSPSTGSSSSPGASTPTYHGAAPGVEGLTRDIAKAHGAVATSEKNAAQLQSKSAAASNEASPTSTSTSTVPAHHAAASAPAAASVTVVHKPVAPHASASATAAAQAAAQQVVLKHELAQGKTVLLLFWNPKSSDDQSVRGAVRAVSAHQKGAVAVHVALAGQVGLYGSVTKDVQVLQTPTLLIVGKKGAAVTITGLVDRYAIEQAILEAKKAATNHA